jgi:hypothetical protein
MSGRIFPELAEMFTGRGYDLTWLHSMRAELRRGPEQWAAEAEELRGSLALAHPRPTVVFTHATIVARALRFDPKLLDVRRSKRADSHGAITAIADLGGVYIPVYGVCLAAVVIDVGHADAFDDGVRAVSCSAGEPTTPVHPRLGRAFRAVEGSLFEGKSSKYFTVHREPRADVERVLRAFFGAERYAGTLDRESLFGVPVGGGVQ